MNWLFFWPTAIYSLVSHWKKVDPAAYAGDMRAASFHAGKVRWHGIIALCIFGAQIVLYVIIFVVFAASLNAPPPIATTGPPLAAGGGQTMIHDLWNYLTEGDNWSGKSGLWANITDHLTYSFIAIGIAIVIAVPLGLLIGHTGKGSTLVVGTVNASRALPTFGLMVLVYILIAPNFTGKTNLPYILPVEFVLLLLAIPPLLSNTYAGVQSVDPAMRDAARGMGMTGRQMLVQVELPNAFPLMMSGLRASTLQVIATATIGAYIGLGGLGAPIYEATQQGPFQDNPDSRIATGELLSGAVLVALLALALDLILATIQRYSTSRGITGRYRKSHLPGPANALIENSEPDGGHQAPIGADAPRTEATTY